MKCTKCGEECIGFATGIPSEDICEDCAFPTLKKARESAAKAVEESYFKMHGEKKSCGEIFRGILGMK
jgi:hypothetical protein